MFKPEKDFQPFFEIDHVNVDNINFVTMLRKDNSITKQIKVENKHIEAKKVADAKVKNVLEANKNDEFSIKETNCINLLCAESNMSYRDEFQKRIDIQTQILEAVEILSILEEHLSISQSRYDEAVSIQNKNQLQMNNFISKGSELKEVQEELRDVALGLSREV